VYLPIKSQLNPDTEMGDMVLWWYDMGGLVCGGHKITMKHYVINAITLIINAPN
jgi:hypothetical protein